MKHMIALFGLIVMVTPVPRALAADAKSQPALQNQIEQPVLQQPSIQKPAEPETSKNKADTSQQEQRTTNTSPPPQKVPLQSQPIQQLPQAPAGRSAQDMQQSRDGGLPQVNQTVLDTMRDSVHIRVSGVGPDGGSVVGGDNGPLLIGLPEFIVLVEHGPLSMTGVVPGEATGYDYYLYVHSSDRGYPTGCSVDPRTGLIRGASPGMPEIQNDGRVRVQGRGLNRQIRNVKVPVDESRVLRYHLMLCVVGTRGEPREYTTITSNVATIGVLNKSSQPY
ncbi:MAG: hypothetical protein U5P41_08320 [Gammaproteobacteria bacterium]|nr:hypothetical protein [Gammaproteobacteria bacterium]